MWCDLPFAVNKNEEEEKEEKQDEKEEEAEKEEEEEEGEEKEEEEEVARIYFGCFFFCLSQRLVETLVHDSVNPR